MSDLDDAKAQLEKLESEVASCVAARQRLETLLAEAIENGNQAGARIDTLSMERNAAIHRLEASEAVVSELADASSLMIPTMALAAKALEELVDAERQRIHGERSHVPASLWRQAEAALALIRGRK